MGKPLSILLVEDDIIEIMKFHKTISPLSIKCKVTEAKNGEEAMNLLTKKSYTPDLILLDLNMPKVNGIELLGMLKNDAILKNIPTVILTTSSNPKDLLACYEMGVAGYMTKPFKYEDYVEKITKTLSYWSESELFSA